MIILSAKKSLLGFRIVTFGDLKMITVGLILSKTLSFKLIY